jgi:predicted deacetylase
MPDVNRSLIVSFHDLHPRSRETCQHFLTLAAKAGVHRQSLLVVPRWHGSPPFDLDAEFVSWLHQLAGAGHNICLHGNTHEADEIRGRALARLIAQFYTNREGEFFQLTHDEALCKLADGLELFGRAGLSIHGFTAPAWLLSADGASQSVASVKIRNSAGSNCCRKDARSLPRPWFLAAGRPGGA